MQTVSRELLEMVGEFEGFRSALYNDPAGHASIGFGHLVHLGVINGSEPQHFKQSMTREQALALLRADLANGEQQVNRQVSVPLKAHQFDALVSFVFNVGGGALADSLLLTQLNAGDYDAVPREMARFIFSGGVPFLGLIRRRQREGTLFARGIYQAVRPDEYINQEIINAFARAETKLNLPLWTLLRRTGLMPEALAAQRRALYIGTPVAQLPNLSQEERLAVLAELPVAIPLSSRGAPRAIGTLLSESPLLAAVEMRPPRAERIVAPAGAERLARRVVSAWNRYGGLLTAIADALGLDPALPTALLACAQGRLGAPTLPVALHDALGYESPQKMEEALADKRWRIVALFDLLAGARQRSPALDALRVQDWMLFAALYYGIDRAEPMAAQMARAVEWWQALAAPPRP